ncbi:nucleotidyl transferase domain-containing protein [Trypanosoma grayi]|uniref:nucleotidyl transferase domain-containing protein n=1 Tax=Trypanosoma grayi TaxID=71804 RepID=UPI0004F49EFC|nr:nucleotidyl transferase domain-containing protein [Trypanosoma grayi]KEG12245.1 nucleotidyl transferase domain-containing protein [Trypanosoma grayi]
MGPILVELIEAIHISPVKCVMYIAGAGSSAISHLTGVAACSRTLLDARVPYSAAATTHMLDDRPAKMVTAAVARQLAQHAYHRAKRFSGNSDGESLVGIGSTSAVQTNRTRHGKDCAFVAAWSQQQVMEYAVELPGHLSRTEQEEQVTLLLLKALADCANVPFKSSLLAVEPSRHCALLPDSPLRCVMQGETACVVFNTHSELRADLPPYVAETYSVTSAGTAMKRLLFPGSFSPLHWGHTELAQAAARTVAAMAARLTAGSEDAALLQHDASISEVEVTYEIAVCNADKGMVGSLEDLEKRVHQFIQRGARVAVTTARLFTEKAVLFPGHGFIVGIDTVKRILDPKYYGDSREAMLQAVRGIGAQGVFFVVGGRVSEEAGGVWEDLTSVDIPEEVRSFFIPIQKDEFHVDVSSTALRKRRGGAS